jgi:hypothetical protein
MLLLVLVVLPEPKEIKQDDRLARGWTSCKAVHMGVLRRSLGFLVL